jgi:S-DNA-T family DNA segregation ATPase FtsK/SpoIIIE
MTLAIWSNQIANQIFNGLNQELQIIPGRHYFPVGYNAARVLSIKLGRINPYYLDGVRQAQSRLGMWAGLDDTQSRIRVGYIGTMILLEIPKPMQYWEKVTIEQMSSRHMIRRGPVATLGLGLQNDPKRIDFKEPAMAHVLIAGQTRSGKTNTQKVIAWNLCDHALPGEARLIIFDVVKRGYNWRVFSHSAHLTHPIVTTIEEAEAVFAWAASELTRRADQGITSPKLFFIVDEARALLEDSTPLLASMMARVASIGGEFGLHLILATQYPQIKMLGSAELKRNITTRLCGKVDDAHAAANALGDSGTGAETLQGYGDFLLKDFDGLSRLTVVKIEDADIERLPRADRIPRLPLTVSAEQISQAPPPSQMPDPVEPAQVALALFMPMGTTKLVQALGVGTKKAKRIRAFADDMRRWADNQKIECLPEVHPFLERYHD